MQKVDGKRRRKDAKPGPFDEDTRILFAKDVDDIRMLLDGVSGEAG